MKYLIISEKPSVAADLSRALSKELGKFTKKGKSRDAEYFDSGRAAITSAVGHLVELKMPTGPNGKNLPWNFNALPAIPKTFELQPIEKTGVRLRHVLSLARKKEYEVIVNACDAGREGELIFQYIMDIGKISKPVKRLWMRSMTTAAIQEAWKQLRDGEQMLTLAEAAKCRSESDWLVGLNSTRALTCFRSRHGGFNITAAGRVQTPTLAILSKREDEIRDFRPENYWEVHADFAVEQGQYPGKWIDPDWRKDKERPHSRSERIWNPEKAEKIRLRCQSKLGVVTEEKKPSRQISPQLYDLTTLQREAPFTAKNTLGLAQALYERHKMLTYPRTDSRYLPEDYMQRVHKIMRQLADANLPASRWAMNAIENKRLQFEKRIFNNSKVSDHFAIIPTGRVVKLNRQESKIYDMVVRRFIAVFFPHAQFEVTKRLTTIHHGEVKDTFLTKGKILTEPGWLAVYGRTAGIADGKEELVAVNEGESASVVDIEVQDKATLPPARYTDSTLLAAMEGAGKLIDDDELREAMAERGLGTPATRASTIEGLLRQKYIVRDGHDLSVTAKGLRLIELCKEMDIKALSSASMTGEWEAKLNRMERGEIQRDKFMEEIKHFTVEIVEKARSYMEKLSSRVFSDLECPCPACNAPVLRQTDATYECGESGCDFRISKYIATRNIRPEEAKELFTKKELSEREGFVSRFNKPFSAGLKLSRSVLKNGKPGKWKTEFVFETEDPDLTETFTKEEMVKEITLKNGIRAKLYATERVYHVPELKTDQSPDGFRLGKFILRKELQPKDVEALFTQGKTALLNGFISKRTKRPFKAHLTFDFDKRRIGFEFAPSTKKVGE